MFVAGGIDAVRHPSEKAKKAETITRHLTDRGKIESRRKTGTCARHQRRLATALKRARHVAFLPFTAEHIRLSGLTIRG